MWASCETRLANLRLPERCLCCRNVGFDNEEIEVKPTKTIMTLNIKAPKGCNTKQLRTLVQQYVDKVLVHDVDWDYSSLLELMVYKLSRMRRCIGVYGHHTDSKEVAAQIKKVEDALRRLKKDDYQLIHQAAVEKKFDVKTVIQNRKAVGGLVTVSRKGGSFNKRKYEAEMKRAINEAMRKQLADLDIAFDTMKSNILKWWD